MANQNQIKFGVGYEVDKASIQKVKQSLKQLQNIKIGDFKGTENELIQVQQTAKQVEIALQNAFNAKLNTINLDKFNAQLNQSKLNLNAVYQNFAKAGAVGRDAFGQMTSQILATNTQLTQTKTLLTTMGQTMMNTVKWGIASSIMNTFTQSVRQSVEYVKNLDSALTDIRIVTGDSTDKMSQFADQANRAAQALGRSTMDYTKAALTFYQQGLSDEDVAARTEATLKAQNITGAGQEMADYLTAVWNGYKVANEEAELYVDKLAAVADSSASNMAELATAMSKVASTANMLGVPVDKLNAQIATITATTRQAPETVGNALKTIYARINDIATGADGAQISLGNYSEKMAQVGFSVLDANGKLRDTGDVIDEIGAKWDTLSREQQIYLARTMAGQRQYNNLLALFENWGRYTDLVNVSMDAQGATMEKNARYLDSLAAKLEQFGAAEERVKSALINQNDLKGITDFGTKAVNLFASLIEGIGGGGNAMLALGSIVTSVFGNIIGRQIGNTINKHRELKNSIEAMSQAYKNTQQIALQTASAQADSAAYKQYIQNMQNMQRVWSAMSVEQIKAQQERYNDIRSLQEQATGYEKTASAGQKLVNFLSNGAVDLSKTSLTRTLKADLQDLGTYIQVTQLEIKDLMNPDLSSEALHQTFQRVHDDLIVLHEQTGIPLGRDFFDVMKMSADDLTDNEISRLLSILNRLKQMKIGAEGFSEFQQKARQATSEVQKLQAEASKAQKNAETVFNAQSVIKFASGIGQIASSINTVINLTKTWNNENISLGEKLIQTFTTIGFMIPMILGGIKNISTALGITGALQLRNSSLELKNQEKIALTKQLIAIQQKIKLIDIQAGVGLTEEEILLLEKEAQLKGQILALDNADLLANKSKLSVIGGQLLSSIKNVGSTLLTFLTGPAGIVIAIGALATIIGITLYNSYNKAKKAAQQANKEFQSANNIYKETKQSVDDLKSSWDSLQSAKDNLNELTIGTKQWKSALEDVNSQVTELIQKYPELAKYAKVGANGAMEISEQGYQEYLNQQQKIAQGDAAAVISARQRQTSANNNYIIQQESRNLGLGIFNNELLTDLVEAINNGNDGLLNNEEQLRALTNNNQNLIEKIQNSKDQIINLAEKVKENSEKTQNLTTALIEGEILNPEQVAKSYNPSAFAKILASEYEKELQNQGNLENWAEKNGLSKVAMSSQNSNESAYILINGNTMTVQAAKQLHYSDEDIQKALEEGNPSSYVLEWSQESKEKIVQLYKEYRKDLADRIQYNAKTDAIEILDETKENVINSLNIDDAVTALTSQEIQIDYEDWLQKLNQLAKTLGGENIANTIFDAIYNFSDLEQLNVKDLLNTIYKPGTEGLLNTEKIKSIANIVDMSQEEVVSLLQNVYTQLINEITNYLDHLPRTISNAIVEAGGGAISSLDLATQKNLGYSLQKGASIYGQEGIESVLSLFQQAGEEGEKFIQIFSNANISTPEDLIQLETNLKNIQNGSLLASKEWLKLKQAIENTFFENPLDKIFNEQANLQKILKDTKKYSVVNEEDYNTLVQVNSQVETLFKRVADGYQLIGSKEQLSKLLLGDTSNYIQAANAYDRLQQRARLLGSAQTAASIYHQDIADQARILKNYIGEDNQLWSALGTNAQTIQYLLDNIDSQGAREQLEAFVESAAHASEKFVQSSESLRTAAALNAQTLSELNDLLANKDITDSDFTLALQKVSDLEMENLGFDVNQYQDLVTILQITNEELKQNEYQARQVAKAQMRVSAGMEDLISNFEDWSDVLLDFKENGDFSGLVENWSQIREALANLFNTDEDAIDMLGPDFIVNNLDKIQAVKDGVEGAYEQLDALMDQQLILNAYGKADFSQLDQEIQNAYNLIQQVSNDATIQVGAVFTGQDDLVKAFNRIVEDANWTSDQAQAAFAQLGYDVEVEAKDPGVTTDTEETQYYVPPTYRMVEKPFNLGPFGKGKMLMPELDRGGHYQSAGGGIKQSYEPGAYAIRTVTKNGNGSGGNISRKHVASQAPRSGGKSSGGGGGSKGGGGSAKQPTMAKISTDTISTKQKQTPYNPYEEVEKSYERQEDLLKDLDELEKHLQGEDRLNNIQQQNKELIKQNSIIEERQKISEDAAEQGTTAWYRNQLLADEALKDVVRFDPDGQVNETVSKQAITNAFNTQLAAQKAYYEAAQNSYNNWIENVWNKYSGEQQQANKKQKEQYDEDLKNAKKNAQDKIKLAEEEYNNRTKLLENYQKALEEDNKFYEQYLDNIEKLIENRIAESKIKVDLAFDFGQTERQWQEFENKFIKRLQKDDIFANAKASFRELQSYFNSSEITQAQKEIDKVRKEIALIQSGQYSSIYGITQQEFNNLSEIDRNNLQKRFLDQATKDLQDYQKKLMKSLEEVQDKQEEIQELYLDSIDKAKDKMDDVISQYERINDLVEHNIKLTELLYGDNAGFDIRNSYYSRQSVNNSRMLENLRQQQAYWQSQLNNANPNSEDWKRFKENLENVTDAINAALESQLNLLATKFENKIQGALANIQNKLTNGLGNTFLDNQWEFINADDEAFLDAVNSKFGIDEIEQLYEDAAADAAGNITQQQRINKLMNDQLKALREKDKLTQYDIDRAKAALEVEKARMALEDARNNKTKMRLRRDSQGNYTYQYVADEEKLSDLQSALANAESQLYNMDKEHYKQQLNEMYDTYKDYLERRANLEREMQATQDADERARIQARIKLLEETYTEYADNITGDLQYTLSNYLTESAAAGLGVDLSQYSTAEQIEFLKDNLPYINTEIQTLADTITGEDGILNSTRQYLDELTAAFTQYNQEVQDALSLAGTSVLSIASTIDDQAIAQTEQWLGLYEEAALETQSIIENMQKLLEEMQKFMNEDFSSSDVIQSLYNAEQMLEKILNPDQIDENTILTSTSATIGYGTLGPDQDINTLTDEQRQMLQSLQDDYLTQQADFNTLADELALSDINSYTENILANADEILDNIYNTYKDDLRNRLEHLLLQEVNSLADIINSVGVLNNSQTLDQNVTIEASFPNVTNHTEIEQALNNLVNMASQQAARQRP